MAKTITISNEIYEKLARIKGNKSFSEVIDELLEEKKGNFHLLLLAFGSRNEKEAKNLEKEIKEARELMKKWLLSLIQAY